LNQLIVGVAGVMLLAGSAIAEPPTRIAFGSCAKQNKPQPFWHAILAQQPEMMLMLGDNIYADTQNIGLMVQRYQTLGRKPAFQMFRENVPILATWDDHDFGQNNAGRHYPIKEAAQQAFLSFFNEPADSPRWQRPGVYRAWRLGSPGQRLQVILLDTRYFRDRLRTEKIKGETHNLPHKDRSTTLLGQAQWDWLKQQLQKPATVRLIGSSIQVVAQQHRFEKWQNFPHERQRLFDLIEQTDASGVIFLSGDRHHLELSCDRTNGPYPMYDLTSSGLNSAIGRVFKDNPNRHRIGQVHPDDNFGLVQIDWQAEPVEVTLRGLSATGQPLLEKTIALTELADGR
jgi:alkaline phosphatase D